MKMTIYAKRKQTKEGKKFITYLATLTKKDGTAQTVAARFNDEHPAPKAEQCPMIIEVEKTECNMSRNTYTSKDGEIKESHTLWIKEWKKSSEEYVDHSMDDFE